MKYRCSDYAPQSNKCNSSIQGRCPMAEMECETEHGREVRCPRMPFYPGRGRGREHYVKHMPIKANAEEVEEA